MRLLTAQIFVAEEFYDDATQPSFTILSHTCGDDEVTFGTMQPLEQAICHHEIEKIRPTCEQALRSGLSHAWVDTC